MIATSMALAPAAAGVPNVSDWLRAGREHYRRGEIRPAIAVFQAGLALAATVSIGVAVDGVADLHAALANAFMLCDDIGSAAENYKAALRLAPHFVACWCNLGIVHQRSGMTQDAISLYLEALRRNPGHRPSRTNLVQALAATRQFAIARTLLLELLEETPEDAELRSQLGKVCFELGDTGEAVAQFERAVALAPGQAENFYWVGAILQARGESEAAWAAYAHASRVHPILRRTATKSPPAFRVLALFAPFVGNTPVEFLFKDCAYQTSILSLLPGSQPDVGLLAREADVVVNLVSDADQGAEVLPLATAIARSLGKPVVNDPAKIQNTTRDATALALADVEGCRVPRTVRIAAGEGLSDGLDLVFPLLARQAGMHGGDVFEKLDDVAALAAFLAAHADHDRYVIDYIDYRSADGFSCSSARKSCPIILRSGTTGSCIAMRRRWRITPGCRTRRNVSCARPSRSSAHPMTRRCEPFAIASVSTISASIAGSTAMAISSCSRSTPPCWCTTRTRNFLTRTCTSAGSRSPSTGCWRVSREGTDATVRRTMQTLTPPRCTRTSGSSSSQNGV